MKVIKNEGNDLFYQAMGGIDPEILAEIEETEQEIEGRGGQIMKKKVNFLVAAACCVLLLGAGSGFVRYLNEMGGVLFYDKGSIVGGGFTHLYHKVLREENEQLFYIYEENTIDITDYCSKDLYFVHSSLDEKGTGSIMVIGGDVGERGYSMYHYENGVYLASQSEISDTLSPWNWGFHYVGELFQVVTDEIPSNFPLMVWSYHSSKFLGLELSSDWISLPETIQNQHGTAHKIADSFYWVQGEESTSFNVDEESNIIRQALEQENLVDFSAGIHENQDGTYTHFVRVGGFATWTETEITKAKEILDKLGFSYVLELN